MSQSSLKGAVTIPWTSQPKIKLYLFTEKKSEDYNLCCDIFCFKKKSEINTDVILEMEKLMKKLRGKIKPIKKGEHNEPVQTQVIICFP